MEENFRLLKPYLRGFPLILFAMILAVAAAKKYLGYVTPMYESTVKLKLADVSEGVPSSNLFKDLDVFASSNKIAAEIEVIKSSVMINKVLDSLDFDLEIFRQGNVRKVELYHESPFIIKSNFNDDEVLDKAFILKVISEKEFVLTLPNGEGTIKGIFDEVVSILHGKLLIKLDQEVISAKKNFSLIDNYEFIFLSRSKLVSEISKNLDVVAIDKDVAVIRINIKSPIAEKAALFVNKMSESYINDYIETKYRAAQTTVKFLEDRIEDISSKLSVSEKIIQKYRDNRNITNIHQETETDLRQISQLKIQQANLKMSLDAIVELDNYINDGKENFLDLAPNFEAFTDLLSTEIIKKIKQLQSDKKDLLLIYTPQDERVKIIDLKINDLTSYLIESINNTRKSTQTKYDRLSNEISEVEKVFIGVPEKERMLTILNREFEIYQRSYNFLNEKKIEAEIAQAARIAFHRVISPAAPSKVPVSPNRPIIIIVSAIMAMFGSIVLIFIVHLVKAKVNDVYTIERNSALPIALLTPFIEKENEIQAHFLKEAIQLELKGLLNKNEIITLSSGKKKEGRSFHSLHLTLAMAAQGRKVLIIDATDTLKHISTDAADTSPSSSIHTNVSYLSLTDSNFTTFTKIALEQYLSDFKKSYDMIVINNEPMTNERVGLLLMSVANTNLFILDARKTPESQIGEFTLLQKEFEVPNTWFVLNRAGYNPNVIKDIIRWVKQMRNKFAAGRKV
jgi:uncharacterized protein involved in exopolysaccharide biosynthesis